jgi:nucleoside-diphosphate-sugar epimerase
MANMGYDLNKILITGASGYIGNYFYENLKKKYSCIPLSKSKNFFFYNLNLLNKKKLKNFSKKISPTLVIHFANNLPNSKKLPNNYIITKNILDVFRCPVIFLSSMTVYNSISKFNLHEKLILKLNKNNNEYAYYKLKTERLISRRKIKGDISIRIPGVFGGKRKNGFIYNLINSLRKNKKFRIKVFTGNWSAIHISHLYSLILKLIETNKIYHLKVANIAYKNFVSIPIAIKIISNFFGRKINIANAHKFKKIKIEINEYEKRYSKINCDLRSGLKLAFKNK